MPLSWSRVEKFACDDCRAGGRRGDARRPGDAWHRQIKMGDAQAPPKCSSPYRIGGRRFIFDDHAGAHFEVQGMAEKGAVAPV